MLNRLKKTLHIETKLFEKEKKRWRELFILELNKILNDEDLIVQAFNERENLRKNKVKYNQFSKQELSVALHALDHKDDSIYDLNDPTRLGNDLPWFTKEEIRQIPPSAITTYESAIFLAKANTNEVYELTYFELMSKKPNDFLDITNDKMAFTESLSTVAKPFILEKEAERTPKPFFERHPWVKYALIGVGIMLAITAIGVGIAASFGALGAVAGAGALIGTLGGLLAIKKTVAIGIGLSVLALTIASIGAYAGIQVGNLRDQQKQLDAQKKKNLEDQNQSKKEDEQTRRRTIVIHHDDLGNVPTVEHESKKTVEKDESDEESDSDRRKFSK